MGWPLLSQPGTYGSAVTLHGVVFDRDILQDLIKGMTYVNIAVRKGGGPS